MTKTDKSDKRLLVPGSKLALAMANLDTFAQLPPGFYHDIDSLYLDVKKSGKQAWVWRYRHNGRTRDMGLGALDLEAAREARNYWHREMKRNGIDPIDERKRRNAATATHNGTGKKASFPTFREWFEVWIAAAKPGWKNAKHAGQVRATVETHVFPLLSDVLMPEITSTHVVDALRPIWHEIPETARRVRQRIEAVCINFMAVNRDALAAAKITMANPAERRLITEALLKQRDKKGNHAALHYEDMPGFMADLRSRTSVSAVALEFTILTATRTCEVIGARWSEIDFGKRTWTIPAPRMKNGVEHVVPLSERAIAILKPLREECAEPNAYVFPGMRYNEPLSNMAMLKMIEIMGFDGEATTHGCRATFRTWASEETKHDHEVKEKALSHTIGDETERSYNRGPLLKKRAALMDDWAGFLTPPPAPAETQGDNVVRLRAS